MEINYLIKSLPPRMNIPQAMTSFLSLLMYPKRARTTATTIKMIAEPHNRIHDL